MHRGLGDIQLEGVQFQSTIDDKPLIRHFDGAFFSSKQPLQWRLKWIHKTWRLVGTMGSVAWLWALGLAWGLEVVALGPLNRHLGICPFHPRRIQLDIWCSRWFAVYFMENTDSGEWMSRWGLAPPKNQRRRRSYLLNWPYRLCSLLREAYCSINMGSLSRVGTAWDCSPFANTGNFLALIFSLIQFIAYCSCKYH